jgi:hypothetical protein
MAAFLRGQLLCELTNMIEREREGALLTGRENGKKTLTGTAPKDSKNQRRRINCETQEK